MNKKGLLILLGVFVVVVVVVLWRGFGTDESMEDRKANYNQQMEEVMRSNDRGQDIREEAEEFQKLSEGSSQ